MPSTISIRKMEKTLASHCRVCKWSVIIAMVLVCGQNRSRSYGPWRSSLTWVDTVCHSVRLHPLPVEMIRLF